MGTQKENAISRREMMTGLGAGLAGTVVGASASTAEAQSSNGAPTVAPFVDPTTKYPKPPVQLHAAAMAGTGEQDGSAT